MANYKYMSLIDKLKKDSINTLNISIDGDRKDLFKLVEIIGSVIGNDSKRINIEVIQHTSDNDIDTGKIDFDNKNGYNAVQFKITVKDINNIELLSIISLTNDYLNDNISDHWLHMYGLYREAYSSVQKDNIHVDSVEESDNIQVNMNLTRNEKLILSIKNLESSKTQKDYQVFSAFSLESEKIDGNLVEKAVMQPRCVVEVIPEKHLIKVKKESIFAKHGDCSREYIDGANCVKYDDVFSIWGTKSDSIIEKE